MSGAEPRGNTVMGLITLGAGVLLAAVIYFNPEQLRAPAWVAYTACAVFALAGALMLITRFDVPRLKAWLPVALLIALMTPGAWVAFGPGERECETSTLFAVGDNEAWCRGAFGFGTLVMAGFVFWAGRRALRGNGRQ